jgi:hypothetical protein
LAKVSGRLLEARRLLREGAAADELPQTLRRLPIQDRRVAIEVRLLRLDSAIEELLLDAGLVGGGFYRDYAVATGSIDLERLEALAAIEEVAVVKAQRPPRRRSGSVISQGDASVRADQARAGFSVDGTGVQVGILSDSFNAILAGTVSGIGCNKVVTGTAPQAADELPASVVLLDDCTFAPNCGVLLDEGRAAAEIVHDLAPGAEILFHSGFNNEADFATAVGELRGCGADVIVDDVIFEDEPMFQDGLIAQAAQAAVDAGVVYLSAAGNDADFGIDDLYVDVAPGTDDPAGGTGDDFHDFGGSDAFASITVKNGCGFTAVLQWNEPFSGTLGPGASSDLDLLLCTAASAGSCSVGFEGQGCGVGGVPSGDPVESVSHKNESGSTQTVYLAVDNLCDHLGSSASPLRLRLVVFADDCSLGDAERNTTAGCATSTQSYCFESGIFEDFQIYGHPAAAGALAVAASFYEEIDSNGTNDPPPNQIDVEPFSSRGGALPFYFGGGGSPLPGAPVERFKPDVTASDGTNNSFFGADLPDDLDGFPNFVGTSAAAPHAAGVAALLLHKEPGLSGTDVGKLLGCTARDIEGDGKDVWSGSGLIDAVDAISALTPTIAVHKHATLTSNGGDANQLDAGDELTYSYEVTNTSSLPLESVDVADNHMGAGALGAISCGATTLAPGAMTTCSATYTVVAGDVSAGSIANDATATGLACGASAAAAEAMDSLTLPICELDRVLSAAGPVTGTVVEEACRSIDSGASYAIQGGADVTFRAGRSVILRDQFSVATGAEFTVEIDPDLSLN